MMLSFSPPAVSDDNPRWESLFRALKYAPAYPSKPCESVEVVRWNHGFVQWYNNEHRHSASRYVTPCQRHSGEDQGQLKRRAAVYEAARQRNPERWSGEIRNWHPVKGVWLNRRKKIRRRKDKLSRPHDQWPRQLC